MKEMLLVQQENINLITEKDNLEKEIERKGNIIVKLLEVIAETGNEDLKIKALEAIKED